MKCKNYFVISQNHSDFVISQIIFFDITNLILRFKKIICDITKYFVISQNGFLDIKNRFIDITKWNLLYQNITTSF